jgi:hypothetical protein
MEMELRLSRSCDAEGQVARGQHPDIDVEARLVADMAGRIGPPRGWLMSPT